MYTVKAWEIPSGKLLCHSLVCRYHELLDKHMGRVPLSPYDRLGPALHIKDYLRLRQVEIKASPGHASFPDKACKLAHQVEVIDKVRIPGTLLFLALLNYPAHGGIRHPPVASYQALVEFPAPSPAPGVKVHLHGKSRAVLARAQAAQVLGERPGQHWHHASGEVYARAPAPGLKVNGAVPRNIMPHVRYMDPEPVAPIKPANAYRVVKILCALAIDRHCGQSGQQLALAKGFSSKGFSFLCKLAGESLWKRELLDNGRDLIGRILWPGKLLYHLAHGRAIPCGVLRYLHERPGPVHKAHRVLWRDVDIKGHSPALWL